MRKSIIWLIVLALTPALAGCMKKGNDEPPTSSQSSEPPKEGNITAPKLALSQCTGFIASTSPYPRAIAPGEPPPGWEPEDQAALISYVVLGGYDCRRINVGPYERGPIRIVWDGHDHADIPPDCIAEESPQNLKLILNAILVNDTEVASYLRDAYGLPAHYSAIQAEIQDAGPLKQHLWSWGPGQTQSELTFVDDGTHGAYTSSERFFWQNAAGIGVLDMDYEREGLQYADRPAHGIMESPMLLASSPTSDFAGPSIYFPSLSGEGIFSSYRDLECKDPEPL